MTRDRAFHLGITGGGELRICDCGCGGMGILESGEPIATIFGIVAPMLATRVGNEEAEAFRAGEALRISASAAPVPGEDQDHA